MKTYSYTTRILAARIRDSLTHNRPHILPLDPESEQVCAAAGCQFELLFGHPPSECTMDTSAAWNLCEEATRLACQDPSGPAKATFLRPCGGLVVDASTYTFPGAREAAEEDAHRYGWKLIGLELAK